MKSRSDYLVEVCASCLTASCWHGEFMCEASAGAGTKMVHARELRAAKREHPSNYSIARLRKVVGSVVYSDVWGRPLSVSRGATP